MKCWIIHHGIFTIDHSSTRHSSLRHGHKFLRQRSFSDSMFQIPDGFIPCYNDNSHGVQSSHLSPGHSSIQEQNIAQNVRGYCSRLILCRAGGPYGQLTWPIGGKSRKSRRRGETKSLSKSIRLPARRTLEAWKLRQTIQGQGHAVAFECEGLQKTKPRTSDLFVSHILCT